GLYRFRVATAGLRIGFTKHRLLGGRGPLRGWILEHAAVQYLDQLELLLRVGFEEWDSERPLRALVHPGEPREKAVALVLRIVVRQHRVDEIVYAGIPRTRRVGAGEDVLSKGCDELAPILIQ